MKPRLLDLFCGAGGAARGYQEAGFYVVGVDVKPQPRYAGDEFHQADALAFPLDGFDAIHASPPCQAYTSLRSLQHGRDYPDLVEPTRARLVASGVPYAIENVPGAPLRRGSVTLCGSMFGLDVRRHRVFETNVSMLAPQCQHWRQKPRFRSLDQRRDNKLACVVGVHGSTNYKGEFELRQRAMGIDWMPNRELTQAIPPAYTRFIGRALLSALSAFAGALVAVTV